MKTSFVILFFMVLNGCAKKNPNHKTNPVKDLLSQHEALTRQANALKSEGAPFNVNTKNLKIVVPNKERAGKIKLITDDAKALYHALKIAPETTDELDSQETANVKRGEHLKCFEIPKKKSEYFCEFDFQYKLGLIHHVADVMEIDQEISYLYEDYDGYNLHLDSLGLKSHITLRENSALVLYTILEAPEVQGEAGPVKTGRNYSCTKIVAESTDDVVTCKIFFNHETGKVKELK